MKENKSVKVALDVGKLKYSCIKSRSHMPNMEALLNQISTEITRPSKEPLWISKTDLDYSYGQLKLSDETSKHCNFAITGGNLNGY